MISICFCSTSSMLSLITRTKFLGIFFFSLQLVELASTPPSRGSSPLHSIVVHFGMVYVRLSSLSMKSLLWVGASWFFELFFKLYVIKKLLDLQAKSLGSKVAARGSRAGCWARLEPDFFGLSRPVPPFERIDFLFFSFPILER